jgi:uncharacterized membrane protein
LKSYLLTGLVIVLPLYITLWIFWKLFLGLDSILGDALTQWVFLPLVGHRLPGVGFLLFVLLVLAVGVVTRNIFGKRFLGWLETVLFKIPLISSVYRGIQQVSGAFLSDQKGFFKAAVLVPFPCPGSYSLAFLTHEFPDLTIQGRQGMITVFLPTTPNPTSGFFLMIHARDVVALAMTVEDALKIVVSGGVVKFDMKTA